MRAFGLAFLAAVLFGAATPASKVLLRSLEPFQLAGLLYLGAAIAMLPVVAREGRSATRVRLDRKNAARLAGAVLFGGVLGPLLLLFGLRLTLAGSVSLLLNLEGVATAILGVALFREHLGRAGSIGVAGSILAGALVAGADGMPGLAGGLLTAGACLCWALDNHLTALVDGISPARSTLAKGVVAGSSNLAIGLVAAPFAATASEIGVALVLGALAYGASIVLYIRAAQVLGATRAQAVFATAPFVGAALSFAVLGETVSAAHVAASLLLAVSMAALFWSRHAHPHVHDEAEHVHEHRHDDGHHAHVHAGEPSPGRHEHIHRHERLAHSHPHWPDLHHRHPHTTKQDDPG